MRLRITKCLVCLFLEQHNKKNIKKKFSFMLLSLLRRKIEMAKQFSTLHICSTEHRKIALDIRINARKHRISRIKSLQDQIKEIKVAIKSIHSGHYAIALEKESPKDEKEMLKKLHKTLGQKKRRLAEAIKGY